MAFCSIDGHQGPLKPTDPAYKGSKLNVKVTWENGEVTYEQLSIQNLTLFPMLYMHKTMVCFTSLCGNASQDLHKEKKACLIG